MDLVRYMYVLILLGVDLFLSRTGPVKNFSGSSYIFYRSNGNWYNWERSRAICEQSGYNLVSIESREEWNFLNQAIQKENITEYFIGLWKDTTTGVWRWLSDNSTVDASNKGHWPWARGQPNGENFKENCALMYGNYKYSYGRYDDVRCSLLLSQAGFICEFKGRGEKKSAKATASTITGPVKNFSGSSYIFYRSNGRWYSWKRSKTICEQSGYNLVSIESREEWNFLKQTIQKENTTEYFIGLRKDTSTGVWRWLSDNSTVNASNKGDWPWAMNEPNEGNGKSNCAQMYRDYLKDFGRYNDVSCTSHLSHAGFICEFKEKKSAKATASTITDGEKLCSCYTFIRRQWTWSNARDSYKSNNKILAVMESEQEWQFIKNEIQNKSGNRFDEWFIGLEKNLTTKRWTWINGKSVTIDKWYKDVNNPDPTDTFGLIHKEYPEGFKGSFSTVRGNLLRGWICEEETAACQGICFVHPVPASTSLSKTSAGIKAVITQALFTVQTSPTTTFPLVTKVDDLKKDTNCFSHYLAIAILSAFLFIVMIILAVVLILLRKKQHQIASRNKAVKTSQRDFQESLAINTLNIGPRLEFASRNRTGIERLHSEPLVQQEGVYTALSPESMMTPENDGSRTYTSLVKSTEDSDIEYVNQITAAEYVNDY